MILIKIVCLQTQFTKEINLDETTWYDENTSLLKLQVTYDNPINLSLNFPQNTINTNGLTKF